MKPRIGVTTTPGKVDDHFVERVDRALVDAVLRAGGVPFGLPVLDLADVEAALLGLDGLLLTGGGDVDPTRYGELPVPEVFGIDPGRDAFEAALVLAARGVRNSWEMEFNRVRLNFSDSASNRDCSAAVRSSTRSRTSAACRANVSSKSRWASVRFLSGILTARTPNAFRSVMSGKCSASAPGRLSVKRPAGFR